MLSSVTGENESKQDHQSQLIGETTICAICRFDTSAKTTVEACQHFFCFDCILEWTKTKNVCPLCNCAFDRLLKSDGSYKTVEVSQERVEQKDEESLECLDWQYFLGEVEQLLLVAEQTKSDVFNSRARLRNINEERRWAQLHEAIVRLNSLRCNFESHGRFDPRSTLTQLFVLQDVVHTIRSGAVVDFPFEDDVPTQRYGADDEVYMVEDMEQITLEDFLTTPPRMRGATWDEGSGGASSGKRKKKKNKKRGGAGAGGMSAGGPGSESPASECGSRSRSASESSPSVRPPATPSDLERRNSGTRQMAGPAST